MHRLAYNGDVITIMRDGALIFGMLFGKLVDQIHGFQGVCCDPLQPSFGVFQGGYIPLGLASSVDVAQSGSNVTQKGIQFACSHKQIIRVIARLHQVFSRAPGNHLR
jgi:hypothetical protein